jgi:hypothetical protein
MPRAWEEHWPLAENAKEDEVTFRNHMLQTIGNLTLLTQALNTTESNAAWPVKKHALIKYSKLLMNSHVQFEEVWDEKAILKRSRLIAERAKLLWPRPQA